MRITENKLDRRHRRGRVRIEGDGFACRIETDWSGLHRRARMHDVAFGGLQMPARSWFATGPGDDWISDLDARADIDTLQSQPLDDDEWGNKKPAWTAAQLLPGLYAAAERAVLGTPARFKALVEGLDRLDPEPS